MSKEMCEHTGWGRYPDETGPTPAPTRMEGCAHCSECPTCGYRMVFVQTCTCDRRTKNYTTAMLGGYEQR